MKLIPYLYFAGNAEQALEHYQQAFGGDIPMLQRYKDGPPEYCTEVNKDQLMHGRLVFKDCVIMLSDALEEKKSSPHSINIDFDSKEELEAAYNILKEGGMVHFQPQDMFWNAHYGKLTDKFGINWDLNFQYPENNE